MKRTLPNSFTLGFALVFLVAATAQASDPLPSWNDGKTKFKLGSDRGERLKIKDVY